jgi:hypothetical protein
MYAKIVWVLGLKAAIFAKDLLKAGNPIVKPKSLLASANFVNKIVELLPV